MKRLLVALVLLSVPIAATAAIDPDATGETTDRQTACVHRALHENALGLLFCPEARQLSRLLRYSKRLRMELYHSIIEQLYFDAAVQLMHLLIIEGEIGSLRGTGAIEIQLR